jgi:hypothetical protein
MRAKILACTLVLAAGIVVAMPATAATPQNTAPPTIIGTLIQGHTLKASNGSWNVTPTSYDYQWQRCSTTGTGCANIAGASSQKYTLTSADVNHTVMVLVTARTGSGHATASSAPSAIVASTTPPKIVTPPAISGTPSVGETLSVTAGTWTGGVRTYSFQWQTCDTGSVNCVDVPGATGKSYGVRASDAGNEIRVKVTARSASGATTVVSDSTSEVSTGPGSTTTSTETVTNTVVNKRPTVHLLRATVRFGRVYATYRVCDDSGRRVTIIERDGRVGVRSSVRRWTTSPQPCKTYRRSWKVAARFHGKFVVRLWAVDYAGLKSRSSSRTVVR